MAELKHILKEIEFRQNYVGEGFLKPPHNNFHRVNIFGEISHCENFLENSLYLTYEFDLPIGWKIDDENEYYVLYKHENSDEENINKIKTVSQISTCYSGSTKENAINIHGFSLPFDLELLSHDGVCKLINNLVDKFWPKLLVQINSVDSYKRHRIEGYTFISIPSANGHYSLDLPCYKPKEDNYMKIYSFFLGGSRRIPDLKDIAKTYAVNDDNIEVALNKYGIQTEFSGTVHINLNVIIQSKHISDKNKKFIRDNAGKETYKLLSHLEEHVREEENLDDMEKNTDFMNTKYFGGINRHEGN